MQFLLLFTSDQTKLPAGLLQRIFESEDGFHGIRFDEPGGDVIQAEYSTSADWTTVGLSNSLETITLSGITDASLQAALNLQRRLRIPLRIIDDGYNFDLNLSDYANVQELWAAIESAE